MRWNWGWYLLLVLPLFSADRTSRTIYPQDFFRPPVSSTMRLSGTFGELRPNHFHSGIDIKGGIGVPILSAGAGYVSRIKVAPDGYGNHVYIDHPNGYTTVYAHLNNFSQEIEDFIRQKQREIQKFEIDWTLPKGQILVKPGQLIGKMGNTGHSFGPHLHFEIRETETDKPINPLLFGLKVEDDVPPKMHAIKLYQFDSLQSLANSRVVSLVLRGNVYRPVPDTLDVSAPWVGLGLKVYDHMNAVSNWNGIYELEMTEGQELSYGFRLEAFGFDETRYLNAHLDFEEQSIRGSYFHRCFSLPGNRLSIYFARPQNGMIEMKPGQLKKVRISTRDVAGNAASTEIWLRRGNGSPPVAKEKNYQYFLPFDKEYVIDHYDLYLKFPRFTFYEDLYMTYFKANERPVNTYSPTHVIHQELFPVHQYYIIGLRPVSMPPALQEKAFIAQRSRSGRIVNCGGQWQDGGMLQAKVRSLGSFCVMTDTIPPTISVESFTTDMRKYSQMSFKIGDNIGIAGNLPGLQFKATIDNEWIPMQYDEKNRRLYYRFDDSISPGKHTLQLEVWDPLGNKRNFTREFLR